MSSGAARIDEASSIAALRQRASRIRPVPAGMLGALTVVCWAVWIYLVLPLVSLVLWAAGVRLFVRENAGTSYVALARTLLSYSAVLVVLVGLLAVWILWNVARYGGKLDRRIVNRPLVTHGEVWKSFRLDEAIGDPLRSARSLRLDLDREGRVLVLAERKGEPSARRPRSGNGNGGALLQPGAQAVVDDRRHPVRARVGEVKEVVKER
jgi:poly-beta-1,6-N-acetyl-D-glucosamine biosynthesis protein PgaD